MIILDENVFLSERRLLEQWRIRVRQIGSEVGRKGMKDPEIISFLQQTRRATFFSRDRDFFHKYLCHANYCLVHLDVKKNVTALFIRRLLRHPEFNTRSKRMGKVIQVTTEHIYVWKLHASAQRRLLWIT